MIADTTRMAQASLAVVGSCRKGADVLLADVRNSEDSEDDTLLVCDVLSTATPLYCGDDDDHDDDDDKDGTYCELHRQRSS